MGHRRWRVGVVGEELVDVGVKITAPLSVLFWFADSDGEMDGECPL